MYLVSNTILLFQFNSEQITKNIYFQIMKILDFEIKHSNLTKRCKKVKKIEITSLWCLDFIKKIIFKSLYHLGQ